MPVITTGAKDSSTHHLMGGQWDMDADLYLYLPYEYCVIRDGVAIRDDMDSISSNPKYNELV